MRQCGHRRHHRASTLIDSSAASGRRCGAYAKNNDATLIESSIVDRASTSRSTVTTDGDARRGREGPRQGGRARARPTPARGSSCSLAGARRRRPIGAGAPAGGGARAGPEDLQDEWERARRADSTPPADAAPTTSSRSGSSCRSRASSVGENAALRPRRPGMTPGGYHYKCGNSRRARRQLRRPGRPRPARGQGRGPDHRRRCTSSASARSGARPATYNHLHIDVANSGPIGAGAAARRRLHRPARGRAARGPPDRLGRARAAVLRLRRRRRRRTSPARPTRRRRARSARAGTQPRTPPRRCAWRPSRRRSWSPACTASPTATATRSGVFQQRDWLGHLRAADGPGLGLAPVPRRRRSGRTSRGCRAGQLAQDVQVSAFPDRYDQRADPGARADRDATARDAARSRDRSSSLALAGCGALRTGGRAGRRAEPSRRATTAPAAGQRRAAPAGRAAAQGALGRGRARAGRRARSASSAWRASWACGRRRSTSRPTPRSGDLRWERWGSGSAEGTGSCACATATRRAPAGGKDAYPATIRLSEPRLCGRSTYFDRGADRARRFSRASDLRACAVLIALMSSLRSSGAATRRTAAMPAHRAGRAGDQLAAPAARPRVGGLHELGGERAARRPGRRRSRPACRCPTTWRRWASARPCAPRGRRARR